MNPFFKHDSKKTSHDSDHSDNTLVKAVCNGDSKAFAQLVSKYDRRIRALGMGFFKNQTDCDDFVQEVFIKIFANIKNFRGESKFSTWIMSIGYNTAINSVKRRKEYTSLPDNAEIADPAAGPEETQLRAITASVIKDSLKELPERFAMCMEMYFYYDMSYNEISEITGLPVNTIKSHIFRAKKMLKERLENQLN